ncbi:MAG: sigma-70 family RNA polymerase sigma factor [Bacillota bacterium]
MLREYLAQLSEVKTLKPDEEAALWAGYKERQHLPCRQKLIESYQPLVFKIASRFSVQQSLMMDVIQEGTIGLIEAVEAFEPQRGVKFATFAQHRVKGRILTFIQDVGAVVSLDMSPPGYLEEILSSMATMDIADEIIERQVRQPIIGAISRLPSREQQVIRKVFLERQEPGKLAREMNISVSYLYRLQKKALQRLRGMLSKWRAETKTG